MARTNGGLSNHVKDTCWRRADRSTLIKVQHSALNVVTERGKTEATRFNLCAHDQRRRLEAEDCDSNRCAQFISGGRRRRRPPHCLAHGHPTMCCSSHVLSKIAINIFDISFRILYIRGARTRPANCTVDGSTASARYQS